MRVTASWGRRFRLHDPTATQTLSVQARTRGKRLRPVAGDLVVARPLAGEKDWLIESVDSRVNELARPDMRGRREVLAANIELMVVVACPAPAADFFIVDRYLAAARLMQCDAIVVWNKKDIAPPPPEFNDYARIGYSVFATCQSERAGIDALAAQLRGYRSIFVGQSGVGKSSLINALGGDELQRTGHISDANQEGRHTTVAATLVYLPGDIAVIDSPGVRDYAPSIQELADVDKGFVEISRASERCRFANCVHRAEPGCAVKEAVEQGDIAQRRYSSYLRLAQLTRQMNEQKR